MKKWQVSFLSLVVLIALPWVESMALASGTDSVNDEKSKDEYVQLVVSVLRSHVKALQQLTAKEIKYSDNVVMHAVAIKDTWDMLGPMDWHAAEAMRLQQKQQDDGTIKLTEKDFDIMADHSLNSINRLSRSALIRMRNNDRDVFMNDLNVMMQSCKDCHKLLPKNTAPAVWKGLKGKL